jgi:hypothetical protein
VRTEKRKEKKGARQWNGMESWGSRKEGFREDKRFGIGIL